jgi:hypothetical protein
MLSENIDAAACAAPGSVYSPIRARMWTAAGAFTSSRGTGEGLRLEGDCQSNLNARFRDPAWGFASGFLLRLTTPYVLSICGTHRKGGAVVTGSPQCAILTRSVSDSELTQLSLEGIKITS